MSRRRESKPSEGAPEWMVTYGDMVTLLLTFFIMLYSMSVVDKQKFEEVANSLRSTFLSNSNGDMFFTNKGKEIVTIVEENNSTNSEESSKINSQKEDPGSLSTDASDQGKNANQAKAAETLERTKTQVVKIIESLKMDDKITLLETKEEIIIRIDSVLLFDLGQADIKESGKEALKKVGYVLKNLENDIFVQGHTDNLPINTLLFPTNWELSTKRATNVVLFLIDSCSINPAQLTATGNGEFRPIRPNDTEENRQKNRRTDIVVKKY